MNKKLQIYVSYTYMNITEKCKIAIEAILNMGHIPVSKNLLQYKNFQIEDIQKLIDNSDIFILFIGDNNVFNNSIELDFAELEYKYAFSKNLPVFPIVLEETLYIPKNFMYSYVKFKLSQPLSVYKFAKDSIDLQIFIHSILYEYNNFIAILPSETKKHNKWAYSVIQTLYQYIRHDQNNSKNLYNPFADALLPYDNHNKCILDTFGNPLIDISNIRIDVSEVNDWILNELNKNPTNMYQLSYRRFEEVIAEILIRKGYNVKLTPATHDGGKDIYVASKNDFGSFLYIVECKKYKPTHKVGVNVLRDLYGTLSKERATYGILVTTSYFSRPAKEFQQEIQFQMSLKDFNSIKQWLCDVTQDNSIT